MFSEWVMWGGRSRYNVFSEWVMWGGRSRYTCSVSGSCGGGVDHGIHVH